MRPTRYFYVLLALVVLVVMPKLSCVVADFGDGRGAPAKFKETRSVTAPAASAIAVETRNGAVTLRRGTGAQTAITAHLAATSARRLADTEVVAAPQPDGTLRVAVDWAGGHPENNESCAFEITVPDSTNAVAVTTSNGRIELAGLSGPARLETSNGKVMVADHAGPVNVRTSNGGVTVALAPASRGPVDVRTSNGSVMVVLPHGVSGRFSLSTSNGSVSYPKSPAVHDVKATKHSASFAIGDITETSTVTTSNGSIDVRLTE